MATLVLHLVGAPVFGDLVLHLIERLDLRRHDAQHLVPDDAFVLGVDRIVLHPGIGGEHRVQQILLRRQRDGRAVGLAALAVDLVDELIVELQLVGDLREPRSRRELVLDLVMQIEDGARGALFEQLLLEIGLRLFKGRGLARLDRRDAQQDDVSELAGDRLAHLVHFELEGGIRDRGIGKLGAASVPRSMSVSAKFISLASATKSVPDWIF